VSRFSGLLKINNEGTALFCFPFGVERILRREDTIMGESGGGVRGSIKVVNLTQPTIAAKNRSDHEM